MNIIEILVTKFKQPKNINRIMKTQVEELSMFRDLFEVVYTSGRDANNERKKLVITGYGSYKVYLSDVLIKEHIQPFVVIEKYNELGGDLI